MPERKLGKGEYAKYQALGNDYLVVDEARFGQTLGAARIRGLCHRQLGAGSDGLLLLTPPSRGSEAKFRVRIFNPDGSEAEKSGNGVRIFARYLYDFGYTRRSVFAIETLAGLVDVSLRLRKGEVDQIGVEMGRASFKSDDVPVVGPEREVVDEDLGVDGIRVRVTCVSVGNPHCVVFMRDANAETLRHLGPRLERHPFFPKRTNVQLARVVSPTQIEAFVWERGAGETLASGSSSCAVAAAARRLGHVRERVRVRMPGGDLQVQVRKDGSLRLAGPATPVYRARLLRVPSA